MKLNSSLLSMVLTAAACGCTGPSDVNTSRNIRVAKSQHSEIWSKGNSDLIPGVYSEDFIGHFPAGTVRGHAGIRSRVEAHRIAFPDWTEVVDGTVADGDRVT